MFMCPLVGPLPPLTRAFIPYGFVFIVFYLFLCSVLRVSVPYGFVPIVFYLFLYSVFTNAFSAMFMCLFTRTCLCGRSSTSSIFFFSVLRVPFCALRIRSYCLLSFPLFSVTRVCALRIRSYCLLSFPHVPCVLYVLCVPYVLYVLYVPYVLYLPLFGVTRAFLCV